MVLGISKYLMSNKKEHGERNQKLSNKLLDQNVYYDWVVTTAFYSAIHFVEDKILPVNILGQNCKNIFDVRKVYKMNGRHEARERLVCTFLTQIAAQYKWLDDNSRNSRYTTYKITKTQAEKAKQYLNEIYKACYK